MSNHLRNCFDPRNQKNVAIRIHNSPSGLVYKSKARKMMTSDVGEFSVILSDSPVAISTRPPTARQPIAAIAIEWLDRNELLELEVLEECLWPCICCIIKTLFFFARPPAVCSETCCGSLRRLARWMAEGTRFSNEIMWVPLLLFRERHLATETNCGRSFLQL